MKIWFPLLCLAGPLLLCQCATEHRIIGQDVSRSSLSGTDELSNPQKREGVLNHLTGWKPEDANWYAASGETDKKKMKENEENRRRSSFETKVDKTRSERAFVKDSVWEDRKAFTKDYAGTKEKKTFAWPWQGKQAATKESNLSKDYMAQNKVGRESDMVAKETGSEDKDGDRIFTTNNYDTHESPYKKKENIAQKKVDEPDPPKIIEDRAKSDDNKGWSISDIRKILNKS